MEEAIQAQQQFFSFAIKGATYVITTATISAQFAAKIAAVFKNEKMRGQFADAYNLLKLDKNAHLFKIPKKLTQSVTEDLKTYKCAFGVINDKADDYDFILVASAHAQRAEEAIKNITQNYEKAVLQKAKDKALNPTVAPTVTGKDRVSGKSSKAPKPNPHANKNKPPVRATIEAIERKMEAEAKAKETQAAKTQQISDKYAEIQEIVSRSYIPSVGGDVSNL